MNKRSGAIGWPASCDRSISFCAQASPAMIEPVAVPVAGSNRSNR
ncbi:hypothetical protein [Lysobacter gummosus]